MNQLVKYLSLLLIFTMVVGINSADAQRRKKKKKDDTEEYFDDRGGFAQRLWYGGGVNFQLSSSTFGGSQMTLGISPMVGYKINDILSIGPRISIDYTEFFTPGTNPRLLWWGVGVFARGKFSETIFAHVEYQYQEITELNDVTPDFFVPQSDNFYLGAGYHTSTGGAFGYEMLVLYNVLEEDGNSLPIEFRIGFTWNF